MALGSFLKTGFALVAAVVLVASATAVPSPTASLRVRVGVSSGTTMALSVALNGQHLGDISPTDTAAAFGPASLPQLPWDIEVRSTSGKVLVSMTVQVQDVLSTALPGGGQVVTQRFERVDTTCGQLMVWTGEVEPSVADLPAPRSSVGPCNP